MENKMLLLINVLIVFLSLRRQSLAANLSTGKKLYSFVCKIGLHLVRICDMQIFSIDSSWSKTMYCYYVMPLLAACAFAGKGSSRQ